MTLKFNLMATIEVPNADKFSPKEDKDLPAVRSEIIRCKDCKHKHIENMVWTCPFGLSGGENFFCGYGTEPYKGE